MKNRWADVREIHNCKKSLEPHVFATKTAVTDAVALLVAGSAPSLALSVNKVVLSSSTRRTIRLVTAEIANTAGT